MTDIKLTASKKSELEKELKQRKEVTRIQILEKLTFAKSLGDLSENAEYHGAREEQGKNESRIQEIEHLLKNAIVVEKRHDGIVGLGSVVTLLKDKKEEKKYTLVGAEEADMASGKIAINSPLGSELIGKKIDDVFEIKTTKGIVSYKILNTD